jgi:hypothetical protein
MLELPIKEKWFDMILNREKTVEYREIKQYWRQRFIGAGLLNPAGEPSHKTADVIFRNGYGRNRPHFKATVILSTGEGVEKWGAEKGKIYYLLIICEVHAERKNNEERTAE